LPPVLEKYPQSDPRPRGTPRFLNWFHPAKHILYNYRGVSKYHFPMYLKEIEYRFNHRKENGFKQFLKIFFGCVLP